MNRTDQVYHLMSKFDFVCAAEAIAKIDERAAKTPDQLVVIAEKLLFDIIDNPTMTASHQNYLTARRANNKIELSLEVCYAEMIV